MNMVFMIELLIEINNFIINNSFFCYLISTELKYKDEFVDPIELFPKDLKPLTQKNCAWERTNPLQEFSDSLIFIN